MDFPKIKDLKRLATACRKAGIANFKYSKDGSFEFSLDPSIVPDKPVSKKKADAQVDNTPFKIEDRPTEDALLFWSTNDPNPMPEGQSQ